MSEVSDRMSRIYTAANNEIWTCILDWLGQIEDVVIDRQLMVRMNTNSLQIEPNQSGACWPDAYSSIDEATETGLITYKGVNLRLTLRAGQWWLRLRIIFPSIEIRSYWEQTIYANNNASFKSLSKEVPLSGSMIRTEEQTGECLNMETVLNEFASVYPHTTTPSLTISCNRASLESVREELEKRYNRYMKLVKTDENKKNLLYRRYLNNRWPRVKEYLRLFPIKKAS